MHDGRRRLSREMDAGSGLNRNTGGALYPNVDTNRANYHPLAGVMEETLEVMISLDDSLERVGAPPPPRGPVKREGAQRPGGAQTVSPRRNGADYKN
jgi:hypothetical protein